MQQPVVVVREQQRSNTTISLLFLPYVILWDERCENEKMLFSEQCRLGPSKVAKILARTRSNRGGCFRPLTVVSHGSHFSRKPKTFWHTVLLQHSCWTLSRVKSYLHHSHFFLFCSFQRKNHSSMQEWKKPCQQQQQECWCGFLQSSAPCCLCCMLLLLFLALLFAPVLWWSLFVGAFLLVLAFCWLHCCQFCWTFLLLHQNRCCQSCCCWSSLQQRLLAILLLNNHFWAPKINLVHGRVFQVTLLPLLQPERMIFTRAAQVAAICKAQLWSNWSCWLWRCFTLTTSAGFLGHQRSILLMSRSFKSPCWCCFISSRNGKIFKKSNHHSWNDRSLASDQLWCFWVPQQSSLGAKDQLCSCLKASNHFAAIASVWQPDFHSKCCSLDAESGEASEVQFQRSFDVSKATHWQSSLDTKDQTCSWQIVSKMNVVIMILFENPVFS